MTNGNVTRTVVYANAYAWQVTGTDDEGKPAMERIGGVEFRSTKPSKREAYKALKNAGFKVNSQFCGFEIVREVIYSMDLDTFIEHGAEVQRAENGRVISD
jgi:hypothetical protein